MSSPISRKFPSTVQISLLLCFAVIAKVGVWPESDIESLRAVALDPFSSDRLTQANFRARNWLGPILAWVLRMTGSNAYFLLHLLLAIVAVAICFVATTTALEDSYRRAGLLLTAMVPGLGHAFFWVGNDAVTLVLFSTFILIRHSTFASVTVGFALGLNHFEIAVLGIGAVAVWESIGQFQGESNRRDVLLTATTLVAVLAGRVVQSTAFEIFGVDSVPSRLGINLLDRNDWTSVRSAFFVSPLIVWSCIAPIFLMALMLVPRFRARILVVLALLIVPSFLVFDQTRVFLIASLPVSLLVIRELPKDKFIWIDTNFRQILTVWLAIPWLYVESWKVAGSALPFSIAWLLERLIPGFELSSFPR